jgi:alkyldihydroxyacetonephosphate synthase
MRLQDRPTHRAGASVRFDGPDGFLRGAEAVRRLGQSGLHPSNCRLLDPQEAQTSGAGDGSHAVLVLGFESGDHPQDARLARALELCRDGGGTAPEPQRRAPEDDHAARIRPRAAWETRPAPGGARSSRRPTCATCWSPAP